MRNAKQSLQRVGIYLNRDIWKADINLQFVQYVYTALQEVLGEKGVELMNWVDLRPPEEQGDPWAPLVEVAAARQIQAIVLLSPTGASVPWLTRLPIPVTGFVPGRPFAVDYDIAQFVETSLQTLAEKGCRSVGTITSLPRDHPEYFGTLRRVAAKLKLELREDWIKAPTEGFTGPAHERYGYAELRAMWVRPDRPQGLFVFSDVVARGVIAGVLREQARVPEELKLVLHRNTEVSLLCPLPATFMDSSCRETAEGFYDQILTQLRGGTCRPVCLKFHRVENAAADEPSRRERSRVE